MGEEEEEEKIIRSMLGINYGSTNLPVGNSMGSLPDCRKEVREIAQSKDLPSVHSQCCAVICYQKAEQPSSSQDVPCGTGHFWGHDASLGFGEKDGFSDCATKQYFPIQLMIFKVDAYSFLCLNICATTQVDIERSQDRVAMGTKLFPFLCFWFSLSLDRDDLLLCAGTA